MPGKKLSVHVQPPVLKTPNTRPEPSEEEAPECGSALPPPSLTSPPKLTPCQSVDTISPLTPAECDDEPAPNHAQTIRQSPTTTGAVVMYVGVPLVDNNVPILTTHSHERAPAV